jgi:hypothetical protein
MSITTVDKLLEALGNNTSRFLIDKASIANQTAGRMISLWRATGQPAQGAIPTNSALCTKALLGAMDFTNQVNPAKSYVGWMFARCSNSSMTLEVHDRIAHMGGLSLILTTAQTVNLDLVALAPPADRLGETNYSDLQWWLEVYADGGATASNATINVDLNDGTNVNLTVQAVGGTIRAGNMFALTPLIPAANQGKFIRDVNSVTLSASTGTAGNFGFTVTRPKTAVELTLSNKTEVRDWAALGFPDVPNDTCLSLLVYPSTTSSGAVGGGGKIAHG